MKIAVIGGGISGLGAGLILGQRHEVHLFEAERRLGGHAHTVTAPGGIPLDTGFLVYNEWNYPHLTAMFRYLGVETAKSDMSLSVRVPHQGLEWCGTGLNGVFGQRRNFFRPSFHRMLLGILRFHREAEANLALARAHGWTLGDLLGRYPKKLGENYLLPIGAAIWSTPEDGMLEYPAATFLQFFLNHKLLQVKGRPDWRTVRNGSVNYVERARRRIPHVHAGASVERVERAHGKVRVRANGVEAEFDRVVLATHAPVTAKLLERQSERESRVLGAFRREPNRAVLHRDRKAMPEQKRCWSSWNVQGGGEARVSLTYHLNRLQPLATKEDFFLTLNGALEHGQAIGEYEYHHPRFDQAAIRAQRELPELQGAGGIYFAGAWTRYGFHEDGLRSGVHVAELLGERAPWEASK